jgi:tetratricopeptide (TPR) repeat protein
MNPRNQRSLTIAALGVALALHPRTSHADQWIETRSAHFVVTSNAGQSTTRTLVWQLEQVRSAIGGLFEWARVDLDRPVAVLAVKDEGSMKALAPGYWEKRGSVRPVSVWVGAPDQYYLAIRADVQAEEGRGEVNPHIHAYFSYISLILQQSINRDAPLWVTRGFAGVLSNTIVHDTNVQIGRPIQWHLDALGESRIALPALMKVTESSPEYTSGDKLGRFDAQSWALMHFLMFGDKGVRRPKLGQFMKLVSTGVDVDVAMREAFGKISDLEADFATYIGRSIFSFLQVEVDATVKRESFPNRPLSASESAARLALFHVAMNRPVEARAAVKQARQAPASLPDAFLAEALLLDREGKTAEARVAYEGAVENGSPNGYAHYRLATLRWGPQPDRDTLAGIEKLLLKAVSLNNKHAPSSAFLGEVRSLLGSGEGLPFVRRAIALAPGEPGHRLTAARILLRQKAYVEALKDANAALALARTDEERRQAQALITAIDSSKKSVESPVQPAPVTPGAGIESPRLLKEAKPSYTSEAMRMRVEGVIRLGVVVLPDGTLGDVRVTKCDLTSRLEDPNSKDVAAREALMRSQFKAGTCTETFGLNTEAVRTVKQWQFAPGTKEGTPVAVRIEVEMSFTLR